MYAKFECVGEVKSSEAKPTRKDASRYYGQIKVATGEALHEFFVEPEDVKKYPVGAIVRIKGTIGRKGFNPELKAETFELVKAPARPAASAA